VRKLFGKSRKIKDLTYDVALEAMTADGDKVAKAATIAAYAVPAPAMARAVVQPFRPYSDRIK
jgi:hypothetical protein